MINFFIMSSGSQNPKIHLLNFLAIEKVMHVYCKKAVVREYRKINFLHWAKVIERGSSFSFKKKMCYIHMYSFSNQANAYGCIHIFRKIHGISDNSFREEGSNCMRNFVNIGQISFSFLHRRSRNSLPFISLIKQKVTSVKLRI